MKVALFFECTEVGIQLQYKGYVLCVSHYLPQMSQKQQTQTLIVRLLKTHFLKLNLECEKLTE